MKNLVAIFLLILTNTAHAADGDPITGYPPANGYPVFSKSPGLCVQAHSGYTRDMSACWFSDGSGYSDSGIRGCPVIPCPDGNCNGSTATEYMTHWNKLNPFPAACVDPNPPPCPSAGTNKSTGIYPLGTNPDLPIPTITCDAGCETSYTGEGVTKRAMVNGVYNYYFGSGSYSYTGNSCSSGTPSPSSGSVPPTTCDPLTQDTGQVNGVTVCLDKQKTDSTNTTTSPPTTNPDGSTTKVTTSTSTNETDNTSTTTTTTTNTATDGTVTTSTSTVTQPLAPPDSFCAKNPTDPSCNKPSDACLKNPDLIGCHNLGNAPAAESVPTSTMNISFSPVAIASNSTCPADQTINIGGQTITVSFEFICSYATAFKPLVIAVALLSGLLIVSSALRE